MPGSRDDDIARPSAPGWYPDPWSADGSGERYFDGERWGTSDRPLGRHTVEVQEAAPDQPERPRRRVLIPVLVIVALAVALAWLTRSHGSSSNSTTNTTVSNAPTSVAPQLDHPTPGRGEAPRPLGSPAAVPAGTGKFELLDHQKDQPTVPVAWDPCRPVHYVVNPAGAPADGAALIAAAIARLHTATGLEFVNDGTTTETPDKSREPYQPKRYGDRWAPVLIAWSDERAYPQLAGYVAGVAAPQPVTAPDGRIVYVSGQVVLDRADLAPGTLADRAQAEAVVRHELGHLAGLDHTSDRTQLMFSEAEFNVRDYGNGDLRGLALLGTQACFPQV